MRLGHYGTPTRACESPLPDLCRRFCRFLASLQAANGGQPVVLSSDEIEDCTGLSQTEQVRVRQTLMREGLLRLSVVGTAWVYALEARP